MPGVLGVYTGADLEAAGYRHVQVHRAVQQPRRLADEDAAAPALPTDKVRFVGDPVAFVVAETAVQAKDAAEAVALDIEPLPAVTNPEEALRAGRAGALRRCAGQCRARLSTTATREGRRRPSPQAAHVTRLKLVNNRIVVNPMEPRAAMASHRGRALHAYVRLRRACSACAAISPRC